MDLLARLDLELPRRLGALSGPDQRHAVCSEPASVQAALRAVLDQDIARGPVFCEWGSGLGAVCAVAASLSLQVSGIEIRPGLVTAARRLLADLELPATFAHGSYLGPGDDDLLAGCEHVRRDVTSDAYGELGLTPADCDIVFAYPWPGEEDMHDRLFLRHATPGALLVTFHDHERVLVQRRTADASELQSLGWMGTPGA